MFINLPTKKQLVNLSLKIIVLRFSYLKNLSCTLVYNCNNFIGQTFINSHSKFERHRTIHKIAMKVNVKSPQDNILLLHTYSRHICILEIYTQMGQKIQTMALNMSLRETPGPSVSYWLMLCSCIQVLPGSNTAASTGVSNHFSFNKAFRQPSQVNILPCHDYLLSFYLCITIVYLLALLLFKT